MPLLATGCTLLGLDRPERIPVNTRATIQPAVTDRPTNAFFLRDWTEQRRRRFGDVETPSVASTFAFDDESTDQENNLVWVDNSEAVGGEDGLDAGDRLGDEDERAGGDGLDDGESTTGESAVAPIHAVEEPASRERTEMVESVAVMDAMPPSQPTPAPVTYTLTTETDLRSQLLTWCSDAKQQCLWQAPYTYGVAASATITEPNLTAALRRAIHLYRNQPRPLALHQYPNVLVIRERHQ